MAKAKSKDEEKKKKKAEKPSKKEVKAEKSSKKSKKVKDEDDDDGDTTDAVEKFNPYAHITGVLDEVSKKMADADTLDDMKPMSTGSLILNLVTGGIRAAWYTNFGPEQSAKTTGALLVMASGVKENIPFLALRDFEGSTGNSIPYVTSIMKTNGVSLTKDQLFGKKDPKTGKWVVNPRIRYSASTRGVGFFNWFSAVLRRLPDKKMLENKWYLVYEDTKENVAMFGEYADKSMPKKYGKGLYLEAPDDKLQGIVMLDSYPNMNPDAKDEDEGDNSLALAARMFSKNLPRVKGYLASKKVAVIGINQLRDVPMAMYGPSESEPGGKALKYNSDVRVRWYPRSLSAVPLWPQPAKKGGQEVERALGGGKDYYKYINIQGAKNKLAPAGREGWIRLWTKDENGQAHGIDPVFDTAYYLWLTGQLVPEGRGKKRSQLKLKIKGQESKVFDWMTLKTLVLGDKKTIKETCEKIKIKPIMIRDFCFKQWASGEGEELYAEREKAIDSGKIENADSDED